MSAVVADLLIWRGWFTALSGGGNEAQIIGLGVCAVMAALTTIVLVCCAVARIKLLHAGLEPLESSGHIAVPALMLRTASAAIVALAAATVSALVLGM